MKSERRHELQHNLLLDWLKNSSETIKPYTNAIIGVLVLALVAFFAWSWWSKQSAADKAAGWTAFFDARTTDKPSDLQDVAERYAGDTVAHWSQTVAADMNLATGCQELFQNKALANQHLQEARDGYMTVLDQTSNPELRQRATYGLGQSYEAMAGTRQSQGELESAIEQYKKLVAEWPNSVYAYLAQQRLKALERDETKEFYDAFAKYEPPGQRGATGERPIFDPGSLGEPAPSSSLTPPPSPPPPSPADQNTAPVEGGQAAMAPDASSQPDETTPPPAEPAGPALEGTQPAESPAPAEGDAAPMTEAPAENKDPAKVDAPPAAEPVESPAQGAAPAETATPSEGAPQP